MNTAHLTYLGNGKSLAINADRCIGCGLCLDVCPHAVLEFQPKAGSTKAKVFPAWRERCMECGACKQNCPVGAISVSTGVGCVAAIINGMKTGGAPSCDCSSGSDCC